MQKCCVLMGLAGSGKSTCACEIVAQSTDAYVYLSSDAIRKEVWGDESIQRRPDIIFDIMNYRAFKALEEGKNVIYDATNLIAARRASLLKNLRAHGGKEVSYICIDIDTPIDQCIARDRHRQRTVGEGVIRGQAQLKERPTYDEGWDIIETK